MEKVFGKHCPECGEKMVLRCKVCHKNRSSCRNEYCTGEGELCCQSCKKIYYYAGSEKETNDN